MTQYVLIEKLVKFVKLTNPKEAAKLKKVPGLCYGLSICHAAMKQIEKLKWWEAALSAITHWNGDITQLNQIIKLPDAEQPQTLQAIFERVLNYVVFYQQGVELASNDVEILFAHQDKVLDPELQIFQMITPKNEIKTIKDREIIVGYFEAEELDILLRPQDVQKSIYIISDHQHAISIGYEYPYWMLYDPDDNHVVSAKQRIHKRFRSKSDLIKEIYNDLDKILSIEKATFVPDNQKTMTETFKTMIEASPDIVLCALPLVAREIPEYIPTALAYAEQVYKKNIVENMLADILATAYQSDEKWTGLHYIARYAPKYLADVLDVAVCSKKGSEKIAKAAAEKNRKGITGLQMVIQYSPECIDRVLEQLYSAKEETKWLVAALSYKNKDQAQTDWAVIRQNTQPHTFKKICAMLLKSPKIKHTHYLRDLINNVEIKKPSVITKHSIFSEKYKMNANGHLLENKSKKIVS